jgi:hypothetical protein
VNAPRRTQIVIDETVQRKSGVVGETDFLLYLSALNDLHDWTPKYAKAYDAESDDDSKAKADYLFRLLRASKYSHLEERWVDWEGPTPKHQDFLFFYKK